MSKYMDDCTAQKQINKNRGGEAGIGSHLILQHNAFALTLKHHSREDHETSLA